MVNVIGISNDLEEENGRKTIQKYNIPSIMWDEDLRQLKFHHGACHCSTQHIPSFLSLINSMQ